jgi:hypothetical protein
VGRLGDFLRRGRGGQVSSDLSDALTVEGVRADVDQRTDFEEEMQRKLALIREIVHDPDLEDLLDAKILQRVWVPEIDKNGYYVPATDEAGNVLLDEAGRPRPKLVQRQVVNDHFAAIRVYLSHKNRLSIMSPKNVKLHTLYLEDIISDAKMSRKKSQLQTGEIAYMYALLNEGLIAFEDACNGKFEKFMTNRYEKDHKFEVGAASNHKGVF